jgi:hypothetical protein
VPDAKFVVVFKAVKIQVMVFWIAMPCSDVAEYKHFTLKMEAA